MPRAILGTRIRERRRGIGITQAELARRRIEADKVLKPTRAASIPAQKAPEVATVNA